jgi:spore coat polysaccharide biosynthesis protein SpsF
MTDQRTVAIIQARMGSTRLPGKVLEPIQGDPMLCWVVDRTRLAESIDEVVVATTIERADDAIFELSQQKDYPFYRGSPGDVLDRYWQAANLHDADVVVRITADCPLIDPGLIDDAVETLVTSKPQLDFVANRLPWERTYPIGLDVEVCWSRVLGEAWRDAKETHQREHVMPFIYEHPDRFRTLLLNAEDDYGELRWTVDTVEDLEFIRQLVKGLPGRLDFNWRDVLRVLEANPELAKINASVEHKTHQDVESGLLDE